MMREQGELWELRSGTWLRDRGDAWRLARSADGTVVDPRLPSQDVARLIGACRELGSGECFPPEFSYSQRTGAPLGLMLPKLDFPWVPPFGAAGRLGQQGTAHGLRQTALPLSLAPRPSRSAQGQPDRRLPPLPPGQYRFIVDKFGVPCPTLMAVEPQQGRVHMLLPESTAWLALEAPVGAAWGSSLSNPRGWRMEPVHDDDLATACCPTNRGLASITPNALGLAYALEHTGDGPALGGPVAWGGEIWLPIAGAAQRVHLIGKPRAAAGPSVLPTQAPVPRRGFEAPVFDDLQVIWPCDEGQLVLRLDTDGEPHSDWITWPGQAQPLFAMGCPYLDATGTFWQLCRSNNGQFEYVKMASNQPQVNPAERPCLSAGCAGYCGTLRIEGDPWEAPQAVERSPTEIVAPLLESQEDGAVIGLRMAAAQGVIARLHASQQPCRAVLQVEVAGARPIPFGTIEVRKPWLALLFMHDGHLWVDHPELPQALGWKLAL